MFKVRRLAPVTEGAQPLIDIEEHNKARERVTADFQQAQIVKKLRLETGKELVKRQLREREAALRAMQTTQAIARLQRWNQEGGLHRMKG
jgi:hypothetical protein